MSGLKKILKATGGMIVEGEDGTKAVWVWDYKNDKPKLKSEMTKDEIKENEKLKFEYQKNL